MSIVHRRFKIGDVVVLKSGGPKMTVWSAPGGPAGSDLFGCAWFRADETMRDNFAEAELDLVSAQHPIALFAEPCVSALEGMIHGRTYAPELLRKFILDYRTIDAASDGRDPSADQGLDEIAAVLRNAMWLRRGDLTGYQLWMNADATEQGMWRRVAGGAAALVPRP